MPASNLHLLSNQMVRRASITPSWQNLGSREFQNGGQQYTYYTENEPLDLADSQKSPAAPISYFKLFRFAKPCEFGVLFFGLIFATINAAFVPVGIIIYGEFIALLIDRTTMANTTPTITMPIFGGGKILFTNATKSEQLEALRQDSVAFGIGCTVFSALQFVAAALSVNFFNSVALRQVERVKESFFRSVLRQDITWYDLNTTVNFPTKVSDDVEKYREGIGEKVPIFVYLVLSFVASVVVSFVYGWELTLVLLACSPVVILSTALVAKVQSNLTLKELEAYNVAGVIAEEVFSSIRTVVAFGGEKVELKRYSSKLAPATYWGTRKGIFSSLGAGTMWFIIHTSYAIAFWYGVGLILDSRREETPMYTPATVMIIFFSVLTGAMNVGLTSPHIEAMATAKASAATIFQIIDRKSEIDSLSPDGSKPEIHGDMKLVDIEFRYPARRGVKVLNGLNLEINCNETVALVGQSGCGKSTVLQLIQRLYDPERGQVLASGHDVRNVNVHHLRKHIAVVGQEPVLFAGTIKENIRVSNPKCTDAEIVKAAREAYCHNFIKKLPEGYNTLIGERGAQLSGGQKQRIALARALIRNPKLLILDEATSALDSHSEAKVQKALDDVAKSRTTVMVCHRLSTVLNADRIVLIDKGQVMEQGTHEELMKLRGHYYQLVLENEPSLTHFETDTSRRRRSRQAILDQVSAESFSSDEYDPTRHVKVSEKKVPTKEKDFVPTTFQVLNLCTQEKCLMSVGVLASLCMGSTFPLNAVLFGETYGLFEIEDEKYLRGESNIICLMFVGLGLYAFVACFVQTLMFNTTGVRLTARLRVAAFEAMLKQEIGWFDIPANGVGALCSRLAADAAAVQGATGTRIGTLMQATATIFLGVLLSLFYSWKMTLVSLVCVPIIIGSVVLEGKVVAPGFEKVRQISSEAYTIAAEAISNIRTVAAFCGEKEVIKRYQKAGAVAVVAARKNLIWRGPVFACGQTAPVVGYALALWYGGWLVADEEVPYKNVIKVSEALIFGSWMMGQALAFAPNFGAAIAAAGRVMTMLGRTPLITSTKTPSVVENYIVDGRINYKEIYFRYPTRKAQQILNGLSLEVPSGKRVAPVGPSGCGKSTLIQLLQRFYEAEEGSVLLDDYNIVKDMRLGTLRRNLGIVSQEPVLFDRSIKENIAYGDNTREIPIEEIVNAAKAANIHSFIESLPKNYDTRVGARASQLSGGQKQRIAIARALVRNPRVLLLDEATSALDTHGEKVVQEALDKASEGRTCIIIAHRLTTVMAADVICVIDKGCVQEKGTHSELMALDGVYSRLYQLQCGHSKRST